jgi:dolichol kinase
MVALIFFWRYDLLHLFYFFAVCFILNILCEFAYSMNCPVIAPLYGKLFRSMLRKTPQRGEWIVSGSPPVFAAAALVCLLFPQAIAAMSLGVMLTADTAAALIGRRFGKHKLNKSKSVEGTVAFIGVGILFSVFILWMSGEMTCGILLGAILGVILAAVAELYEKQLHLDDNLTIPILTGFPATLIFYLF